MLLLGISFILVFLVFFPLTAAVCLILNNEFHFRRQPVYQVLLHLFISNLIALAAGLIAGIYELTQDRLFDMLDNVSGSLALWYRHIYATLTLLLSLNRLAWVLDLEIPYEKDIYKYFFFLMWFGFIVLIMFAGYVGLPIGYNFATSDFVYFTAKLTRSEELPDYYYLMCVLMISSFAYGIAYVIYVRYTNSKVAMNPEEVEIFRQLLALFIPKMIMRYLRHFLVEMVDAGYTLRVSDIFLYRMVPAVNVATLLYFNKHLRTCLYRMLPWKVQNVYCSCRACNVVTTISRSIPY